MSELGGVSNRVQTSTNEPVQTWQKLSSYAQFTLLPSLLLDRGAGSNRQLVYMNPQAVLFLLSRTDQTSPTPSAASRPPTPLVHSSLLLSLPRRRESRLLTEMAGALLCFCLSLYVSIVYYNYLDFRYHWNALDISFLYSTNGVLLALTSGVVIRFLLPKRLSMEQGMMLGMLMQVRCLFLLPCVAFIAVLPFYQ